MFAVGSLVFSTYLLASTLDGNYVENDFRALGQGRVDINRATLSKWPHPLMFRLFDEEAHATARPPEKANPAATAGQASAETAKIEQLTQKLTELADQITQLVNEQVEVSRTWRPSEYGRGTDRRERGVAGRVAAGRLPV